MAAWKNRIANCEVKIHNVDHPPPHCHVWVGGRDLRVDLHTLGVLNPPPPEVGAQVRKGLREHQEDLLAAWEGVIVLPSGGNPVWEGGHAP